MPDDKLKRLSNLLTQMQVRSALNTPRESTNVSPEYLQREIIRRDVQKLENAGNQIDPVTKKPKKYSEQWLQSTGQQIPGLDSEGQSALDALNVTQLPGLAKVVGAIGREGIKRGIGRVATNIINTKAQNISASLKDLKFKHAIKAIVQDKPIYQAYDDEVPYRMMFGLKPREFTRLDQWGTNGQETLKATMKDIYAKNPDGSLRFKPESGSYKRIQSEVDDYLDSLNDEVLQMQGELPRIYPQEFVMGHYNLNPITGRYWDKWDVGLNPGELKHNIQQITSLKNADDIYGLNGESTEMYNSIPTFRPEKVINAVGEIDKKKLALEKTKSILRLLERAAVRKTVDVFTDPVILQGKVKPSMRVY